MNVREEVIEEIKQAPDALVEEVYDWLKARKEKTEAAAPQKGKRPIPDFMGRQRRMFGDKVLPDSMPILDEIRSDRF